VKIWADITCGFTKYPYPPHGWSLEIPWGWVVSKAKIFKEKYAAKLEFPKGWGVQSKKPSLGEVWIFSGTTQWTLRYFVFM